MASHWGNDFFSQFAPVIRDGRVLRTESNMLVFVRAADGEYVQFHPSQVETEGLDSFIRNELISKAREAVNEAQQGGFDMHSVGQDGTLGTQHDLVTPGSLLLDHHQHELQDDLVTSDDQQMHELTTESLESLKTVLEAHASQEFRNQQLQSHQQQQTQHHQVVLQNSQQQLQHDLQQLQQHHHHQQQQQHCPSPAILLSQTMDIQPVVSLDNQTHQQHQQIQQCQQQQHHQQQRQHQLQSQHPQHQQHQPALPQPSLETDKQTRHRDTFQPIPDLHGSPLSVQMAVSEPIKKETPLVLPTPSGTNTIASSIIKDDGSNKNNDIGLNMPKAGNSGPLSAPNSLGKESSFSNATTATSSSSSKNVGTEPLPKSSSQAKATAASNTIVVTAKSVQQSLGCVWMNNKTVEARQRDRQAIKVLIDIVSKPAIQAKLGNKSVKKKSVWQEIGAEFLSHGYVLENPGDKCFQKWRNIERAYRDYELSKKIPDLNPKKPPDFYAELDGLLKEKHSWSAQAAKGNAGEEPLANIRLMEKYVEMEEVEDSGSGHLESVEGSGVGKRKRGTPDVCLGEKKQKVASLEHCAQLEGSSSNFLEDLGDSQPLASPAEDGVINQGKQLTLEGLANGMTSDRQELTRIDGVLHTVKELLEEMKEERTATRRESHRRFEEIKALIERNQREKMSFMYEFIRCIKAEQESSRSKRRNQAGRSSQDKK